MSGTSESKFKKSKSMKSVLVFLFLVTNSKGSLPTKGPPVARADIEKVVARVGEDLKIVCPVEGNPTPIIRWYKDEEVIDHTWTRLKTQKRLLKIKTVEKGDTGVLVCKGINGFGSTQVRIELIVVDPRNYGVASEDQSLDLAPPVFTKKTKDSRNLFKKLPGDSLVLDCEALGSPQPVIVWLHNGVSVSTSPRFQISSLTEEDSGTYTCVASNLVGRASKEFSLTVSSPRVDLPVISEMKNVSVREGETGVVQCSVSSSVPAHVKWLRKVEHGQDFTMSVANMRLVVVESGEVSLGDGLYLSNLVIQHVQTNHQGLYVCFATNTAGGFNYRTTFLTVAVNPVEPDYMEESTLVLALVVGLAAVVLILLTVLIVCVLKAKRKSLVPESPESVRTLMPPTPALPHQTLTIHTNYLDFSYDKNPSDGMSSGSIGSDKNHQVLLQTDRCVSPESNHYEVPFSHLTPRADVTHWHSKDSTFDKEVANHLRFPIHLEQPPWHNNDKTTSAILKPQSPLAKTKYQTYKIENRSGSPGSQKSQFKQYPPFQYASVTEYQNY